MCHLEGDAFDFYYERFARDGSVTDESKCYKVLKRAFVDLFVNSQEPEDGIRDSTSVTFKNDYLVKPLQSMYSVFKNEGFNDAAKYLLLRQEVILIPDLAQFVIFRGASTYYEHRKAVKLYDTNRTA